ncbi:MAG: response regulator transcription factor [Paludibacteraceae bacterium]|nr:response regulator transcription factor [Paludibacteraceae bacterium]
MNKIIVVDDHSLFREGIKLLIENEQLGTVVAEAENGSAFLDLLNMHQPDLVIMDIEMPVMNGLEAIRQGLLRQPTLKFLVLTMLNEKANYSEIIYAGAMGFVLKTAGKKEFERAINTLVAGESYFSPEMLRQMLMDTQKSSDQQDADKANAFTLREKEVLKYLCAGLSVSEIGEKIFLSVKTIEAHRSTLLRKTNTRNTINLVLFAIKSKLVEI